MNKIYKVIWNAQLGCWQAVSELAKNHRPSQSTVTNQNKTMGIVEKISALLLFGLALLPLSVQAAISNTELPTGAQINSGSATISQNGHTLNINQSSQTLSTNWNSFNIGQNATVNFNQNNASSVAINHVLDSNASQIMGRLNANGQVFLLNPNGVVFSKTAQVNVGGLVASTLALTDHDIQNGQFTLKGDANSHASIENYGAIQTSQGGTVALIAPNVKNKGSITTPNGTTHLTSASQVTLALQDGSLTQYQVDQGVFKGLVDNGGAILADNGAVYLTAKAKDSLSKAVVNHSGIIEANRLSQNAKGEIILLGDMQTGTTTVSGVLKAEGKNSQDGGFIETSAAKVKIENSTVVSTRSAGGKTGNWLIDPIDFNINAGNAAQASSGMGATTLANNLANNNVTVQSSTGGSQKGDINVNAEVKWDSANSLTLNAHNDININANVTATHNKGKLNLIYGQDTANSNANYKLNKGAKINLRAGDNFSSKKGTDATVEYKVITALGKQDSTTGADLQGINGNLNGNYVLGADIDATESKDWNAGQGFNPIGGGSNPFTGKLDGLGHTISKLYINRPTQNGIGLIGYAEQAQIRNIGLLESNITGKYYVGGLVGLNSGSINNAYAIGTVSGQDYVGGLVGWNSGSINNAYAMGTVSGKENVGGLVGFNGGSINNAYAIGSVSVNAYVGGLVGWNSGSINNAYATGSVSGKERVGGLVGLNNSGSINNAYATGQVTGTTQTGGLIGYHASGTVENAYWNTETTGQNSSWNGGNGVNCNTNNYCGLTTAEMFQKNNMKGFDFNTVWGNANDQTTPYLLGLNDNQVFNKNDLPVGPITATNRPVLYSAIQNIQQLQNMQSNLAGNYAVVNNIDATESKDWNAGQGFNPIGDLNNPFKGKLDGLGHTISKLYINRPTQNNIGLIGYADQAQIRNIGLLESNIRGNNYVGGLVGWNSGSSINNAYAIGTVSGNVYVGGLIGWNSGSINNAYAMGTVSGQDYVGGLVGFNSGSIHNAYATASVSGRGYVGGLVGWNSGSINNAYATGSVSGKARRVGGLVGTNEGNLRQVYATGQVTGTTQTGGLIGYHASGTVENAYWNTETTGQNSSWNGGNGVNCNTNNYCGLTTAEMFQKNNMKGFDFNTVWGNANDQTTPYLLGLNDNQVFNKNDLPVGPITATNRPALYSAIQNIQQLQNMQSNLAGSFAVVNNIDATESKDWNAGQGFNPIGDANNPFKGKLDGLGYTISKLYINRPTQYAIGLIGYAGQTQIRNIGLLESNIRGNNYVGGLVGWNSNSGSINNAYAMGTVSGNAYVGGLVGWNRGSINNAYATASVSGNDYVGGLVGFNNSGSINNAYATGSVSGNSSVGGLVGLNSGSINNAYWDIESTGQMTSAGGTGLTSAGMKDGKRFAFIDADSYLGGENTVWRMYQGDTAPLLRSFLTPLDLNTLDVTTTYNGKNQSLADVIGLDPNKIFGGASGGYRNAGDHSARYYSHQQGYDLIGVNNTASDAVLKINKAKATVTANSLNTVYNGKDQTAAGFTVSGLVNGETESVLSGVSATVTGKDAGKYTNTATGIDKNYDLTFVDGALDIAKAKATVTANSVSTVYNGQNQTAVGFSATGLVNGEDSSVLTGVTASVTAKDAGSYTNKANGVDKNYDLTFVDGALDIAKAKATVTANSLNTTYNGKDQTASGFTANGLVNGETESVLSGVTASITAKDAGSYTNKANGVDKNYDLTFVDGALDIAKAKATVTANSLNTTYNGKNQTAAGFSATGLVNGETESVLSDVTASVTAKDAGSYTNKANGVDKNYDLTFVDGALDIAKAKATVTANSLNTTYNGKNQTASGFSVIGLVNGEDSSVLTGVTASITAKDAGSYTNKANGVDKNYDLTFVDGALDIAKAKATVTANSVSTVYNGQNQTASGFSATGLVNGETESVLSDVTASVTAKDAGSYVNKANGVDKNYDLTFVDGALDIAKAKATVTANSVSTVYNGKNQTASGFSATGLVNGETESVLSDVTASVTAKDAGSYTNKANGVDKNYDLTFVDGALDIAKAKATVTANSVSTVYNGQNQTASGFTVSGLVNGETESVLTDVSATVTAKDAGSYTNKANGVDKNYDLTFVDGALDIAKAKAIVTANSLNTVYNGKDQTAVGFSASGLVNGETESVLSGVSATVTGKDAGSYTNKANGVDKNYDLTFVDGALDIAKAKATVTANSVSTVYNGQNQTASGFSATGLVNGETESVLSGVTATVSAKDAGSYTNKANGVDKNYDLSFVDGALDIAKAKATVTANSLNTTYNGKNQTAAGFSATGLVNGETESVLSDVTASVTAKDAGSYTNKANGVDKNYDLTFVDGALDIAKAKINQVTGITANNRVYDASTQATLNTAAAQFTGQIAGDELKVVLATGQFSDKNVGNAKQVSIQGISLSGADAHNYELVNNTAQTTADISQAKIQYITGIRANNRTYNGLTIADLDLSHAEFSGIYAGDNLNVATATGQFDNATTGQGKNVLITGLSLGGLDAPNYTLMDTTAKTTADIYMLTPTAYLQAIQFKRPHYLPETQNALNTVNLDVRQGGVNTTGIQILAGEH